MRYEVHIPVEQYGYASAFWGEEENLNPQEVYNSIAQAFKPKPVNELEEKAFKEFLINVAKGGGNTPEDLEKLSPRQREISKYVHLVVSKVYPFKQTK